MITKDNYITAHFIDNERKNIEVLLTNSDGTKVNPYILEYDIDNLVCQELLKICPLDDLHENTWEKKREERENFEKFAIKIAQKDGLIFGKKKLDPGFYPILVKALFEEEDNEDHLFALKLALFEIEKIRDSKDSVLKKKLRQSKNKIEIMKTAFDIMGA